MDTWTAIKSICKEGFDIDPTVLDYVAVQDILELCARGKSNKVIEIMTGFDLQYIEDTLNEFYNYPGLATNLKVDTREIYRKHRYNRYLFLITVRTVDETAEDILKKIYNANIIFDKIERKIEEYYAKS